LQGLQDFSLKAKARIWPRLSDVCQLALEPSHTTPYSRPPPPWWVGAVSPITPLRAPAGEKKELNKKALFCAMLSRQRARRRPAPETRNPLQGYLAHKKQAPLGPYCRNMPRVLGGS